jgi:hypothetical protein
LQFSTLSGEIQSGAERNRGVRALTIALVLASAAARAEDAASEAWSLDLTVHDVGIGIGNSKRIDGLRLNFRDVAPFTVHGINLTLWSPADGGGGDVYGLALGLPATGARLLRGVGIGVFGLAIERDLIGVGIGPLGLGSGGGLHGIMIGGLGMGSGGDIDGLAIGGLGAGCGGNITGIVMGGLGAGAGGNVTGLALGGLGVGAGHNVRGIVIGGLGAGAGGDVEGIALGLGGVGAGGHMRGLAVAGLGIGAGDGIDGLAIAGLGVGTTRMRGAMLALAAGGRDVTGLVLAPGYFQIGEGGSLTGVSVSAINRILGEQHGVVIGIVNYTPSLHGVQVGVINIALNNPTGLKVLPVLNAHFD